MTPNSTNHVLIDHENIHAIDLTPLKGFDVVITIFTGENQKQFPISLVAQLATHRYEIVEAAGSGKNALDFHMSYHAGQILARDPNAFVHFITKDKGFEPLVKHIKARAGHAYRIDRIEELAFLRVKTPEQNGSATISKETIAAFSEYQQKEHAISRLTKMAPASRPRKLKTLSTCLSSQFQKQLSELALDRVIYTLSSEGKIIVGPNDNLSYKL